MDNISAPGNKKRLRLALNLVLIAAFLALLIFAAVRYGPEITRLVRRPEHLRDILNSYGWKGVLLFMLLQVLQVVVSVIPGEVIQFAGGYVYGAWLGALYSLVGITVGSIIVFFVARLLGYPLIKIFVPRKTLDKFNFMINDNRSDIVLFTLFLMPGIPKDMLTYMAGLTPVKPLRFFIIIIIARIPALLASSFIGHNTQEGHYLTVIILSAAALAIFAVGVLFKDRIIGRLRSLRHKSE